MSAIGEAAHHLTAALDATSRARAALAAARDAADEMTELLLDALDGVTKLSAQEAVDEAENARRLLDEIPFLMDQGDLLVREYRALVLGEESAGEGLTAHTGSQFVADRFPQRPRDVDDYERQWDWADRAYDLIRDDERDVPSIAAHLKHVTRPSGSIGFSTEEVARVKAHLFVNEQRIEDYETGRVVRRRFDSNPDIAAAWVRLRGGVHEPSDLVLLEHELCEVEYLRSNPQATYQQAHRHANRRYDWSRFTEGG